MKTIIMITACAVALAAPVTAGERFEGNRTHKTNINQQGNYNKQGQYQGQKQSNRINNNDTNIHNEKRQTGAIANSIACENGLGIGGAVPGGSGLISACWTPKYKRTIQKDTHNMAVAEALAARTGKKGNSVYLTHVAHTIPEARETLEAVGIIQRKTVAASTRGTARRTETVSPSGNNR